MDHLSKVQLGTELNHRFNDDWAIHNRFLAVLGDNRSTFVNPVPAFGEALHADQHINSFQLPGFVRMDAMATYKWTVGESRVTAQINIRNLLDKQYYESIDPDANVSPRLGVYPGAPLMAFGSLRMEY